MISRRLTTASLRNLKATRNIALNRTIAPALASAANFPKLKNLSFSNSNNSKLSLPLFHQLSYPQHRSFATKVSHTKHGAVVNTDYYFETLGELIDGAVKNYANKDIFGTWNESKKDFEWITFSQFGEMVNDCRKMLKRNNIQPGDAVSIISDNRVEWACLTFAVTSLGAKIVPMYQAQLEKDWKHILNDSDTKLVVAATQDIYQKVRSYPGNVGKVEKVFFFDGDNKDQNSFHYQMAEAKKDMDTFYEPHKSNPDDVAFIIYTSGTTGLPKGVELTHDNIVSDVFGALSVGTEYLKNHTSLAFLPWAHVYGLTSELMCLSSLGSRLAIVPGREKILECMAKAKPSVILCVPILFNKIYDGVMQNVKLQSPFVQKLFSYAIEKSSERNDALFMGKNPGLLLNLQHKIFSKLIFDNVRTKISPNLKYMASGGAAANINVLKFFEAIGISILEGYGLTETSPMISAGGANYDQRRPGYVGRPLVTADIRIINPKTLEKLPDGQDGEIIVNGPMVMKGYRNNPAANQEAFIYLDDKRFFRTGDQGRLEDGFLKITGRIKEQYKLENGKYVVPAVVEDHLARGPFILQTCLYGENKKFNVCLVVPNYVALTQWANANNRNDFLELIPKDQTISGLSKLKDLELFKNEDFIRLVTEELVRNTELIKNYEKPKMWAPIHIPFSQENQMLTPKLSMRRKNVLNAYQSIIDDMYQHKTGHEINYNNNHDFNYINEP